MEKKQKNNKKTVSKSYKKQQDTQSKIEKMGAKIQKKPVFLGEKSGILDGSEAKNGRF